MAGRVNTKFVFTLAGVLILIVAVIAVLWYRKISNDPNEMVQRGNEFYESGDLAQALQQWGKALREKPDDVELMLRYVSTAEIFETKDPKQATTLVGQMVDISSRAVEQDPNHEMAIDVLMQTYMKIGRQLGDFGAWNRMYERSQSILNNNPNSLNARKYRGIGQVSRMAVIDVDIPLRQQANDDLQAILQNNPEDADATFFHSLWYLLEARRLSGPVARVRDPELAAKYRQEAMRLVDESVKRHPDDIRRKFDRMLVHNELKNTQLTLDAIIEIESLFATNPEPTHLLLQLADLLPAIDTAQVPATENRPATISGLLRAEQLLRKAAELDTKDVRLQIKIAENLGRQRRIEEAIEILKNNRDRRSQGTPLELVQMERYQLLGSMQYADLLLARFNSLQDDASRNAALDEVEGVLRGLTSTAGEIGEVNMLSAKLAVARRDWHAASVRIDRAISQLSENDRSSALLPEAMLLSAAARAELGELGAATQRLTSLIDMRPDFTAARIEQAKIHLRLQQLAEARKQIDAVLAVNPQDDQARMMLAEWYSRSGDRAQAIENYTQIDAKQYPQIIIPLTRLYVDNNQPDQARQLLAKRLADEPRDVASLQQLINLTPDKTQVTAMIQASRDAGADPKVLAVLDKIIAGENQPEQVVKDLIAEQEDPLERQLATYRFLRQSGKADEAKAALAEAARLKPNHALVVEFQFNEALAAKDWSNADLLAGRASTLNLDSAEGTFFYGRLELERGRPERAVDHFRRGLQRRPVFSDGWRQLGDAQRAMADPAAALISYQRAVEQRPDNVLALRGMAITYDTLADRTNALKTLTRAAELAPNNAEIFSQYLAYEQAFGDSNKALQLRLSRAADFPTDYDNRRAIVILQAQLNRPLDAQQTLQRLIEDEGNVRANAATAAAAASQLGRPEEGLRIIQAFIDQQAEKTLAEDHVLMARYLISNNQFEAALAAYERAIAIEDTTRRPASRELADLLFERLQTEKALEIYQRLFQQDAKDRVVAQRYAESLIRLNKVDDADRVVAQIVKDSGENSQTLLLQALIARSRNQDETAINLLNRAAAIDTRRPMIYLQRGELLSRKPDQLDQAVRDLNKTLELDPNLASARMLLAGIALRRGERDQAISELNTLLKRNPQVRDARMMLLELYTTGGENLQARSLLEESAKLYPQEAIWPRLLAREALTDGRALDAIKHLEQAVELETTPRNLFDLLSVQLQNRKSDDALAMMAKYPSLLDQSPVLAAMRGRAQAQKGQMEAATRTITQQIHASSDNAEQLVQVLVQASDALGRQRLITLLDQLTPDRKTVIVELATAQLVMEDGKVDDTLSRLGKIELLVPPGTPQRNWYDRLLAMTWMQSGAYENASKAYRQILANNPRDLMALNNLAYLLAEHLNQPVESLQLATQASQIAPTDPQVLDTLGLAQFKNQQFSEAAITLQKALEIKPLSYTYLHLAKVHAAQGQRDRALAMLESATTLAKQNKEELVLSEISRLTLELEP